MSVLDFESYKNTGKLEYVTGSLISKKNHRVEKLAAAQREREELDSIALVMEMSTDELIGELTVRNTTGHSIREVQTRHIVEELSQRAIAIEYLLMMVMSSNISEEDEE